jgi:adenylate cyclase
MAPATRRLTAILSADVAGYSRLMGDDEPGTMAALAECQNDPRPRERRMLFRVGIHLGDVFVHPDGRVYGDGVNVAARLQALAEPGGVCVSEVVHAAVGTKIPAVFDALGAQRLKNIAVPVTAQGAGRRQASVDIPLCPFR